MPSPAGSSAIDPGSLKLRSFGNWVGIGVPWGGHGPGDLPQQRSESRLGSSSSWGYRGPDLWP